MRSRILLLLPLVGACANGIHDPNGTGLRIRPSPGGHEGPVDLLLLNRTGDDLVCEAWQTTDCPQLDALDELGALAPGDRWELDQVTCVDVDLACFRADADETELPVRSWRWFIQPSRDL